MFKHRQSTVTCHCCGGEMQEGYIHAGSRLYWSRSPAVRHHSEDPSDVVVLNLPSGDGRCKAYICRACRKIIFDYAIVDMN